MTNRPRRTLDSVYSDRDNAFNFLRLTLAFAVLVGHSNVVGFGGDGNPFRLPMDLGGLAVSGFFALSGFLITRSGRRTPFIRYWWHRGLRIFPGLWVCLLLCVAVVGPLLWLHRHGSLGGYWSAPKGPLDYFLHNFYADPRQDSVGDILAGRPNGALNGSLWTLKYELACYALVGASGGGAGRHRSARVAAAAGRRAAVRRAAVRRAAVCCAVRRYGVRRRYVPGGVPTSRRKAAPNANSSL